MYILILEKSRAAECSQDFSGTQPGFQSPTCPCLRQNQMTEAKQHDEQLQPVPVMDSCRSTESSGPKILAVKLPRERLHVCMAVRAPRVPVRCPQNANLRRPRTWMAAGRRLILTHMRRHRRTPPSASCVPHAPKSCEPRIEFD